MPSMSSVYKFFLQGHISRINRTYSIYASRAYCTGLQAADTSNGKNSTEELRLRQEPGLRYLTPEQKSLRDGILDTVISTCQKYGASPLETPLLEFKTNMETSGPEQLCQVRSRGEAPVVLRPNLKIPHARYLSRERLDSTRLYQHGPVYRRMSHGLEERLLCDFDISGHHHPMMADSECAMFLVDTLNSLGIEKYMVKVRHRPILEGLLDSCDISFSTFQVMWQNLARWDGPMSERGNLLLQLMQKIGVEPEAAQKLKLYLFMLDGEHLLRELLADPMFTQQPKVHQGANHMLLFLKYCQLFGIQDKISFDLSISHHPDFYNGILFDVICKGNLRVADGGWYNGLLDHLKGKDIPCVGVSLDIDSLFSLKSNEVPVVESIPEQSIIVQNLDSLQVVDADVIESEEEDKVYAKTPRGMKDYGPEKLVIRNKVLETVKDCFMRHGAVALDCPVVEPKMSNSQYGEDSHLVYHLETEDNLSLRYDLTVPLARYLAHSQPELPFIRYHIGRVYRRDKPYITRGRLREFYQCVSTAQSIYTPDSSCHGEIILAEFRSSSAD
ncbi:HARS [Cordylochernes scorpioides]|uniref:HARS n=1 Tax=Cordylochernes scorpioides TaxID=51811 RepID=A0ABY6K611_9ARAC|nr:HARS [Cordylochernes scorpioides]